MRFITLNINSRNRFISKRLYDLSKLDIDILCFQEFPRKHLDTITKYFPNYHVRYVPDAISLKTSAKDILIVTLTKDVPVASFSVDYFGGYNNCILTELFYKKMAKYKEGHEAIAVDLYINNQSIRVVNCRLSAAVRPLQKYIMFENLFSAVVMKGYTPIICGDFNINQSKLFNYLTSPLRGFSLKDVFINQARLTVEVFSKYNLTNLFKGAKTLKYKLLPAMQLDYIVVPANLPVLNTNLSLIKGSDHKMLLADLDF